MRRWLRDLVSWSALLATLAGLGGLAWLTRHPDSELLERAQSWTLVGPLARAARSRLLPAPALAKAAREPVSFLDLPRPRSDRGESAGSRRDLPFVSGDGPPPLGNEPTPPLPLPGRTADPDRLAEARALLPDGGAAGRSGPYPLFTDVTDDQLLARLSAVADQAESVYRARTGLAPVGEALETVVLYRRENDYRALQSRWGRIRGLAAMGHTGYGLIALFVGELDGGVVEQALLHELGHLLNRRSLGPALPPWLDEGLADDLSVHRLDAVGTSLELPALGELRVRRDDRIELHGALAGLDLLLGRLDEGSLPPLESLVAMEWEEFVRDELSRTTYAASLFFVRFLLDGRGDEGKGFRSFLTSVARGDSVAGGRLLAALGGTTWEELERDWRLYLVAEGVEAGLSPAVTSGSSSRQAEAPSP